MSLNKAAELVDAGNDFILAGHEKPDGDALGSVLGLGKALASHGRNVMPCAFGGIADSLSFLPGFAGVHTVLPDKLPSGFTLLMLDCHEAERLGEHGERLVEEAASLVILDHHLGEGFCSEYPGPCASVIDTRACSTAEICMRLIDVLGWKISSDMATCFYTAVLTDTGGFRYSNTSRRTFEIAGQLVDAGADPYHIALKCFESMSISKLKLLGLALETLELFFDGRVSVMLLTPDMFELCGARESDTEEFVSYARGIDSVEVAILVKEARAGMVSVSLRSKRFVNVAEIAARFGGGGHFNAAGFKITGNPVDIKQEVAALVGEYLKKSAQKNIS